MEDGQGRKTFPPPPHMLEEIWDILTGELKEIQCFGFAGIDLFLLERSVRTHLSQIQPRLFPYLITITHGEAQVEVACQASVGTPSDSPQNSQPLDFKKKRVFWLCTQVRSTLQSVLVHISLNNVTPLKTYFISCKSLKLESEFSGLLVSNKVTYYRTQDFFLVRAEKPKSSFPSKPLSSPPLPLKAQCSKYTLLMCLI